MKNTLHLVGQNTTVFTCPECRQSKILNVTHQIQQKGPVCIRIRCSCGMEKEYMLERRKSIRKKVCLKARCVSQAHGFDLPVQIVEMSRTGMRLKLETPVILKKGDLLNICFTLPGKKEIVVKKSLLVRHIENDRIGAAFVRGKNQFRENIYDVAIGYFLSPVGKDKNDFCEFTDVYLRPVKENKPMSL